MGPTQIEIWGNVHFWNAINWDTFPLEPIMQHLRQGLDLKGHGIKNVKASLTGDNSYGMFIFGLFILSCHFRLGSHDWDCSPCVYFLGDGVGSHCHRYPT